MKAKEEYKEGLTNSMLWSAASFLKISVSSTGMSGTTSPARCYKLKIK